jgi:hypothetical protein
MIRLEIVTGQPDGSLGQPQHALRMGREGREPLRNALEKRVFPAFGGQRDLNRADLAASRPRGW